ncbi:unnamed protein product [Prunus armeniaca]|uniref:Uncharacterized protein n=1 Tax=Prunus armeniaca TaxID=36596 RepID=A0A6J5X8P7_PRUAR|nr:unnamed protein product [Prunus armeniaca]CAB4308923.1 unnamed protein product [Prunus armeniaca]
MLPSYSRRLDHVGTNCALKSRGLKVEQYGKWKIAVKEVYSIFAENGMKGRRFSLGDDNSSSVALVHKGCSFEHKRGGYPVLLGLSRLPSLSMMMGEGMW